MNSCEMIKVSFISLSHTDNHTHARTLNFSMLARVCELADLLARGWWWLDRLAGWQADLSSQAFSVDALNEGC